MSETITCNHSRQSLHAGDDCFIKLGQIDYHDLRATGIAMCQGVLIRLSGTLDAGSGTPAGRRSVFDERRDGLLSLGEVGRTGIQT